MRSGMRIGRARCRHIAVALGLDGDDDDDGCDAAVASVEAAGCGSPHAYAPGRYECTYVAAAAGSYSLHVSAGGGRCRVRRSP